MKDESRSLDKPAPPIWHALPIESVLSTLQINKNGLSFRQAKERLKNFGLNILPTTAKRSSIIRFLSQFHNILIYVLLISAITIFWLDHPIDTMVILAVVMVNAIVGFLQEGKAEKALEAIQNMLSLKASVLRDGIRVSIPSENLVPGDVVILEAGDKIPADIRFIEAHGLKIQEAILTGESVPVEKSIIPTVKNAPLAERTCMGFSGTFVAAGQAKGVVIATGTSTEIGKITKLITNVETLTTPLVAQMAVLAKWLTAFILLVSFAIFLYGYFIQHQEFHDLFMVVVSLAVSAIPEGLPAVLTITLAIAVQAMAKKNAIVRNLPAIETTGSVSIICSDKTGTLTCNEMMVKTIALEGAVLAVSGQGYIPNGELFEKNTPIKPSSFSNLTPLAQACILCNEAHLCHIEDTWAIEGDPMEGALLVLAEKMGVDTELEKQSWQKISNIPFDSQHRFMATLQRNKSVQSILFVKGAPEKLFKMCGKTLNRSGQIVAIDTQKWQYLANDIANNGQRVLALAMKFFPANKTELTFADVETDLILIGLVGLIDPPRKEVITAITTCHQAGIGVKMITGDHPGTAKAIGKAIGLRNTETVITGEQLDKMDVDEIANKVLHTDIYARTTPEHKLKLVMALQAHDLIIAMTGDGVNDAPALKRADVGIAMGQKGTEAAKEASELVLADDNFASIVAAVQEGRTVYDNLRKVISWTLPTNGGEALTIIVALIFGLALPVSPIQILWVNLITTATLGIALAFEPTEDNTMQRPPRQRKEPILTGVLLWHILIVSILFLGVVFSLFFYGLHRGYSLELARTIALNTLVVLEIFHLFFIRNIYGTSITLKAIKGTPVIWSVILVVTVAQFIVTYHPWAQHIFKTASVPFFDGVLIIISGIIFFILIEAEKQIRLCFFKKKIQAS